MLINNTSNNLKLRLSLNGRLFLLIRLETIIHKRFFHTIYKSWIEVLQYQVNVTIFQGRGGGGKEWEILVCESPQPDFCRLGKRPRSLPPPPWLIYRSSIWATLRIVRPNGWIIPRGKGTQSHGSRPKLCSTKLTPRSVVKTTQCSSPTYNSTNWATQTPTKVYSTMNNMNYTKNLYKKK